MKATTLLTLGLTILNGRAFGEENATCVADEASEEYPPGGGRGGGGGGIPPGHGGGKEPPKQGNPPKEGWPKPPCKSLWTSKWSTWTTTTTTTPSPIPVSATSTSSSASATATAAGFRNGLFYQNMYVTLMQDLAWVQ